METIAIIGGGFSGTMTAVNLARLGTRPLRVCLINGGHPAGRGVAYGTRRPEHLLNVAARNMSAFPDHPNHFLDWLRTRSEYADLPDVVLRESFLPRRVCGDYLAAVALAYLAPVDPRQQVRVESVEDVAVDVAASPGGAAVALASGKTIEAARVVLATGNRRPAPLPTPEAPFRHPAYVDDPWVDWDGRLTDPERDAILLGTGLTMVDVFLTLSEAGWQGTIRAVSRNGLLPLSHFRGSSTPTSRRRSRNGSGSPGSSTRWSGTAAGSASWGPTRRSASTGSARTRSGSGSTSRRRSGGSSVPATPPGGT